jgi:DNA-binding beta-propeller fold protein YncE
MMHRTTARRPRRAGLAVAALAAAAALAGPADAGAAVGDIAPLSGLGACNASTGFLGGICNPGSPIGNGPDGLSAGRHVLSSPDAKHVYVISAGDGNAIPGRIAVFTRGTGGALTPTSCLFALHSPPPAAAAGTPPCVSSGNPDIDAAFAFGFSPAITNRAAFSPDGRQLYVAGTRLAALARDPLSGRLSALQDLGPGKGIDVAVSRDGLNVYAANALNKSQLDVYTRAVNGTLVRTQCLNVDGGAGCARLGGLSRTGSGGAQLVSALSRVVVSPDGGHVYASTGRTLIPLSRNADGTLAPLVDPQFGKQNGCFSFFSPVSGCISQQVADLLVDDLEVSPDGRHVYAGTTAFRRDPAAGRLSLPTTAPFARSAGSPVELTVSSDGRTVYYVDARHLAGIARDPGGSMAMSALAAPAGCFDDGGSGSCQTANPTRLLADVALTPSGKRLYLSSQDSSGAIVRAFSREGATALAAPVVGRARLVPRRVRTRSGRVARLTFVWTHPRSWRALRRLELTMMSARGVAGRVRSHIRSGRIRLSRARGLALAGRGRVRGSGPHGRTVRLRVGLRIGRRLAGRKLRVDALATDARGHVQRVSGVGALVVRS